MRVKPRIKICCISSIEEAQTAVACGAAALGLVGKMPSGPGQIADDLIQKIARIVPPPVSTFLLTSETSAGEIIRHYNRCLTNTIQIVDRLEGEKYAEIRQALPNVKIVQVIHISDKDSVAEAARIASSVDALLLDSGNQNLQIKELGGTGRTHDWNLSREIAETCGKPVFLAGGINAENVREAFEKVRPFGFDLCSSVRTNGKLDAQKLEKFFSEVNKI